MNEDRSWHEQGNCNGHPTPDIWHYKNSNFFDEQQLAVLESVEALQLCKRCPVQEQCLKQGLEDENIIWCVGGNGSIWGGKLSSERAALAGYSQASAHIKESARHTRNVRAEFGRIYG